jgi:hypothetical protein
MSCQSPPDGEIRRAVENIPSKFTAEIRRTDTTSRQQQAGSKLHPITFQRREQVAFSSFKRLHTSWERVVPWKRLLPQHIAG